MTEVVITVKSRHIAEIWKKAIQKEFNLPVEIRD
jgi:hypothetical protein